MRVPTFSPPGRGVIGPRGAENLDRIAEWLEKLSDPHPASGLRTLNTSAGLLNALPLPPYFLAQIAGSRQNTSGQWAHSWVAVQQNPDGTKSAYPDGSFGSTTTWPAYEDNNVQVATGTYVFMRPGAGEWVSFAHGGGCAFPTVRLLTNVCNVGGTVTLQFQNWNPCYGFVGPSSCSTAPSSITPCCPAGAGSTGPCCPLNTPPAQICLTFADVSNEFPSLVNGGLNGYKVTANNVTPFSGGNPTGWVFLVSEVPAPGKVLLSNRGDIYLECDPATSTWHLLLYDGPSTTPAIDNAVTLAACSPFSGASTSALKLFTVPYVPGGTQSSNVSFTFASGACGSSGACLVAATYLGLRVSSGVSGVTYLTTSVPTVNASTYLLATVVVTGNNSVSSVVFNGHALTFLVGQTTAVNGANNAQARVEIWGVANTTAQSGNLIVTFSANTRGLVVLEELSGLTNNALDASVTTTGSGSPVTFSSVATGAHACEYAHAFALMPVFSSGSSSWTNSFNPSSEAVVQDPTTNTYWLLSLGYRILTSATVTLNPTLSVASLSSTNNWASGVVSFD